MEAIDQLTEDGGDLGAKGHTKRRFDFLRRKKKQVLAALEPEFARARAEAPALAGYATAAEAVKALGRHSLDPAKIALTEALLLEIRMGRSALETVLVFGYLKMLEWLLRFGCTFIEDDDLRESTALEAFSESVAEYRGLLANPCHFLQKATLRHLRRAAARHQRERSRIELGDLEELEQPQAIWWESKLSPAEAAVGVRANLAEDGDELTDLLRVEAGGQVPPDRLELVEATILRGEDLAAYVKRRFPEQSEEERGRTYARLQRQRNRTVHSLREVLAPWRAKVLDQVTPSIPVPALATVEAHSTRPKPLLGQPDGSVLKESVNVHHA